MISNPVGGVLGDPTRRGCTAVRIKLDTPIAPGARGSVAFDVDIRVPRNRRDRFGRGGKRVALLSNAIPAIAHREGGAWRLDKWFGSGEAWTYPAAEWRVRLDAPGRRPDRRAGCAPARTAPGCSATAATTRSRRGGCARARRRWPAWR